MTPLPAMLGGASSVVAWRLDHARHGKSWDSGEGSYLVGGRWNPPGIRAVYCSLDPATTILEVAAHIGIRALTFEKRILTSLEIVDPALVHVLDVATVPNPLWLLPGYPSAGQQAFGADLLNRQLFILLPSVVSPKSWNLMFDATRAYGAYSLRSQDDFALDPRFDPPAR